MRWPAAREVEAFAEFAALVNALPAGQLTLEDVRHPRFKLYEDERLAMYYAPLGFVNESARVALVGVTPGPKQMVEGFETARARLLAGDTPHDVWRQVKAQASFKGMRDDLSRWLDEIGLNLWLGLGSCAELFESPDKHGLHTTSAICYPTFRKRRADGTLTNYDGRSPDAVRHPKLRSIITDVLAPELNRVPEAVIVPVGKANDVIEWLGARGTIERDRCIVGLPHPSPASPRRERYFQQAKAKLLSQTNRLPVRTSRNRAANDMSSSGSGGATATKHRRQSAERSNELWSETTSPISIDTMVESIDNRLTELRQERAALERARAVLAGEPGTAPGMTRTGSSAS